MIIIQSLVYLHNNTLVFVLLHTLIHNITTGNFNTLPKLDFPTVSMSKAFVCMCYGNKNYMYVIVIPVTQMPC